MGGLDDDLEQVEVEVEVEVEGGWWEMEEEFNWEGWWRLPEWRRI